MRLSHPIITTQDQVPAALPPPVARVARTVNATPVRVVRSLWRVVDGHHQVLSVPTLFQTHHDRARQAY